MRLEKLWNFLFNFICIAGCAYQVGNVVMSYFQYRTLTRNRFYSPKNISFPHLHYCFRFLEDGLNWTAVTKKYGKLYSYQDDMLRLNWIDILVIRDIFDMTPEPDIDKCLYRDSTGHRITISPIKGCNYFNISKYVNQQYICYHLKPVENSDIKFHDIYSSLLYDSMMYEISYSNILSKSTKIRVTLTHKGLPYISRFYAASFYKKSNEGQSLKMSCQMFKNYYLGYPYDDFICAKETDEFFLCMEECLASLSVKKYGRKLYSSYHIQPEDTKLISWTMLNNDTILSSIARFNDICSKSCPYFSCTYSYCVTAGHSDTSIDVDHVSKGSSIRIHSPSNPDMICAYFATLPFLDFFIYIFSTLGTWFGLVIIQCNPMKLFKVASDLYQKRQIRNMQARMNFMENRMDRRDIYLRHMMMRTRYYEIYSRRHRNDTRNIMI